MERKTKQRDAIWDAVQSAGRPLSPLEIHELASVDVDGIGIATVYRTVKSFQDEGMLVAVEMPGQPPRYEMSGLSHHHHFHCRRCDCVFEMEGCAGDFGTLAPDGFRVEGHMLSLYGLCQACQVSS